VLDLEKTVKHEIDPEDMIRALSKPAGVLLG
jgi:hypothetical protein